MRERFRYSAGGGSLVPPFRPAVDNRPEAPPTKMKHLCLAVSAALGLALMSAGEACADEDALAADEELVLEEIVVTGTRIVSVDGFGQISPVTVVGMEEINSYGFTRVEEILNNLPQLEADQTSFINNNSTGTGNLNLRGLGAKRNLVLIDGRRMQPGGVYTMSPDINQIPAMMIERVEVLTGGASATYGADAVAGVINFIMRRVQGVEVSAGISGYQHDNNNRYIQGLMDEQGFDYPTGNTGIDGKAYNVNIVIGGDFADGRGNATVYANWRKSDALRKSARDYSSCALDRYGTACGGSSWATEVPNFWIAPLVEGGLGPYGYDYESEAFLVLQPDSSLALDDWDNPSNRYNFAPINFFMRPDERWSMGAFVDYEINQHAAAYLETMGFSDHTESQWAESGTFSIEVYPLQLSNDYFPDNFRASLREYWPGEEDFGIYIGKRNTEGGPRVYTMDHTSFRIVAGLKGLLTDAWRYDISYMQAKTSSSSSYMNDLYGPDIAIAVDSRLCEPDPTCIPYEVFTYQGVSEEAADNLSATGITSASTGTEVIQAYVTGNTGWGLTAGNILAVAGYEYRRVDFDRQADQVFQDGALLGQAEPVYDLAGDYSVHELFVEANIPLLAERSFARNMTLDLAYRYSDYSNYGGSSTYRLGLDWQVSDWLRVRTGYNRAVRTPNISELYALQVFDGFSDEDPCAGAEPLYSFEQCARTGVTEEQYGQIAVGPWDWLNAVYGGNPELGPEKADTLTAGVVLDVSDSMQLSLDYWDIRIEDVIEAMQPHVALYQCALQGHVCELIRRGPDGSLWRSNDAYVIGTNWNLGDLHSTGIDVAWAWSAGDHWRLNLIGTYYLKKETTYIPNNPDTTWDCVGLAGVRAGNYCPATPKWRHTASVNYNSTSFWSITGRWRFYDKVTYIGRHSLIAQDELGTQNYLDLSASLSFMETHDVTFGVNNILDREPPLVGQAVDTRGYYDPLGRYLFAQLTLRW